MLGFWRGRGGRAVAAAPEAALDAAPDLADLRARMAELRQRAARSAPAALAGNDIEARLALLERLHQSGLVDDADYEAKKAEILSRL